MFARLFILFSLMSQVVIAQKNPYLLVGTYTSGKSEGIYVYDFNSSTGENKLLSTVKSSNPSYLAVAPDQKTVYAVNENADTTKDGIGGEVSAFSFDKQNGVLTPVNQQFSGGKHPCYVAVDKTGKWVFAGNYSSGNAALLPVKPDGGLEPAKQIIQHEGAGPDKDRQAGPHVHCTVLSPDNKYLLIADLGIDKIMSYKFDAAKGTLTAASKPFTNIEPGSGPRHITFHPNGLYVYLIKEMTGDVEAFSYKNGGLTSIQKIASLAKNFKGDIGAADIHVSPDGKFLYCSNRGSSNNIVIFKIGAGGKLTKAGEQSTMGSGPRNFNFDPSGNFLLVANQKDDIVIFKVNKKTGQLTDTGKRIGVPNPVCVKWVL